jgi:hypothetical protein
MSIEKLAMVAGARLTNVIANPFWRNGVIPPLSITVCHAVGRSAKECGALKRPMFR